MKKTIVFRADGNSQIGMGHLFRSLALAEMLLHANFHRIFATRIPLPAIQKELLRICDEVIELPDTDDTIAETESLTENFLDGKGILVFDGYHFDTKCQEIVKSKNIKLVCIDDIFSCHFMADIIINHAGGITTGHYNAENYSRFFLGPKYALLRNPFLEAAKKKVHATVMIDSVFVCLGGSDLNNDTLFVLKKLNEQPEVKKCCVVMGHAFKHRDSIFEFKSTSPINIQLIENASALEMVTYMKQCNAAVLPPSSVAYEFLSASNGILYLHPIAANQKEMYKYLVANKLAMPFEQFGKISDSLLNQTRRQANTIFDGESALRLQSIFKELENEMKLTFRNATEHDMEQYFEWVNDPETRIASFNTTSISVKEHKEWFLEKLKNANAILWVGKWGEIPAGQLRFEVQQGEILINYSLDVHMRGRGLGKTLLREGIHQLRQKLPHLAQKPVVGFVKKENQKSCNIFRNLEFEEYEATNLKDAYKYILHG